MSEYLTNESYGHDQIMNIIVSRILKKTQEKIETGIQMEDAAITAVVRL